MAERPLALIYVRVSYATQAGASGSLGAQLARCRAYAATNNWGVVGEYADTISGSRDDRPNYLALLSEARRLRDAGKAAVVVTASLDRLGRRVLEGLRCRHELTSLGVPVHSVAEGGEVPEVVANILAAVAQEEVQQLGRRIRAVQSHIVARGWYLGGGRPWGYRWRPATDDERSESSPRAVIVIDPVTAPYVREMFQRAAEGENPHGLERWIDHLPEEATGGRVMRYTNVRRALRSPLYVARPFRGDSDVLRRPCCRWPALVDDTTWQQVQDHLTSPLARQASGRYLLTSLLRCQACDGPAGGSVDRSGAYPFYHCDGPLTCRRYVGPRHTLEAEVLRQVQAMLTLVLTGDANTHEAIRHAWAEILRPNQAVERRIRRLQGDVERGRRRLASAGRLLEAGDLDQGGYELVRDAVQTELDTAGRRLTALRADGDRRRFPAPNDLENRVDDLVRIFRGEHTSRQRQVLATLVERIYAERIRYGKYKVRIEWTPLGKALQSVGRKTRSVAKG